MRLMTVVGARPQFIKAAVLSRLILDLPDVEERLVHTGQHYDAAMSDVFFQELGLPRPSHTLGIGSGTHGRQTGEMLAAMERVLLADRPDVVLVYGDTNSTLAGALSAAKLGIPVAHVEAGLRSHERDMPEEINRRVTDHLSTWHFCPTEAAVENLRREGIASEVHQVGDVMYDALLHAGRDLARPDAATRFRLRDYILCTLHRAGNTDDPGRFRALWDAIGRLAAEIPVVLPLHPRTRKVVAELRLTAPAGLHAIEPVGYREMLALEKHARLVVTDSGGVQKEAYMQGVPCLTLRETTEWTETVRAGWNRLLGSDPGRLASEARAWLADGPPAERPALYGDGRAGERILQHLCSAA